MARKSNFAGRSKPCLGLGANVLSLLRLRLRLRLRLGGGGAGSVHVATPSSVHGTFFELQLLIGLDLGLGLG